MFALREASVVNLLRGLAVEAYSRPCVDHAGCACKGSIEGAPLITLGPSGATRGRREQKGAGAGWKSGGAHSLAVITRSTQSCRISSFMSQFLMSA